jgi:hypothetical protein
MNHFIQVCKMATQADKLTLQVAAATYKDMMNMVEFEKKLRKDLLDGVSVSNWKRCDVKR